MASKTSAQEQVFAALREIEALLAARDTDEAADDADYDRDLERRLTAKVDDLKLLWAILGRPRWDFPAELSRALAVTEIVQAPPPSSFELDAGVKKAAALLQRLAAREDEDEDDAEGATESAAESDARIVIKATRGSAHAPDDPIGEETLTIRADDTAHYALTRGEDTADVDATLVIGSARQIADAVAASGFPSMRDVRPPRPGALRTLTRGAHSMMIGVHDVDALPAFRALFLILDALMDALRTGAPHAFIEARTGPPLAD